MEYETNDVEVDVEEDDFGLLSIIPEAFEEGDYDSYTYRKWEQEHAEPALVKKGFTIIQWRTGDQDSFGPLMRLVKVKDQNGEVQEYYYG